MTIELSPSLTFHWSHGAQFFNISVWVRNWPHCNLHSLNLTLSVWISLNVCAFTSPEIALNEINADGVRKLASLSLNGSKGMSGVFRPTNHIDGSSLTLPRACSSNQREASVCAEITTDYSCWCTFSLITQMQCKYWRNDWNLTWDNVSNISTGSRNCDIFHHLKWIIRLMVTWFRESVALVVV